MFGQSILLDSHEDPNEWAGFPHWEIDIINNLSHKATYLIKLLSKTQIKQTESNILKIREWCPCRTGRVHPHILILFCLPSLE